MGGRASKQQPEPVEGLEEETRVSVVPVFRTSIRVSMHAAFLSDTDRKEEDFKIKFYFKVERNVKVLVILTLLIAKLVLITWHFWQKVSPK